MHAEEMKEELLNPKQDCEKLDDIYIDVSSIAWSYRQRMGKT